MRKKTIVIIFSIIALVFVFGILLNYSDENILLVEHCAMLPGADGCEKYLDSYKEKGNTFTRMTNNLPPKQESVIYEPKEGMIQLKVEPVKMFIQGKEIRMYGYNGQIPGPRIQVNQGDTIYVNVTNNLEMETTVHWHGLRLKNKFDGVPGLTQEPIRPGESFLYELIFPDAGIYWYHPHVREDYQQELGLYGNIFVIPTNKSYYNEVNREEFIFLDDLQLTGGDITSTYDSKINQVLMGRFGNSMFINGGESYNLTVDKGDVVRLFLTDAANTRLFNFSIESTRLKLVGSDGGSYEKESYTNSVIIAPSERATVEAVFSNSGIYRMMHITLESNYTLGFVTVLDQKSSNTPNFAIRNNSFVKEEVADYKKYLTKKPDVILNLSVEFPGAQLLGQKVFMDHSDESGLEWEDGIMHQVNLKSSNNTVNWIITDDETGKSNMDINYTWKVGDRIKMRIINDPYSPHPMQHPIHLHGQRFLVLATDEIPNENLVWKDTVLIPTGKTIDILVDMTNPGKWMTHCHIAEHLSDGMMFEFTVNK